MSCLNKDDALRLQIMGIETNYSLGNTQDFKGLTLQTLNQLIEKGFVDLDERQNPEAPSIGEFWELLKAYPKSPITLHGYIVSPKRDDYRISIEGLEALSEDKKFICAFRTLVTRYPYGIIKVFSNYQYCWYD